MKRKIFLLMIIITISTILNAQERPEVTVRKIMTEDLNAKDEANNENYRAVRIGDQVWTFNPIKNKKYSDGQRIPLMTDLKKWEAATGDAYRINKPTDQNYHGYEYNWYAVNSDKLCPPGWRAATLEDYKELALFLEKDSASYRMYSHMVDTIVYDKNDGRPVRCLKK